MIRAKNISYSYGETSAFKDVSFEFNQGDFVAIIGPNGAGKTTLAKLIMGILPLQKGTLELFGTPIKNIKDKNFIGYVPQHYNIDRLFPGTVRELLHAGRNEHEHIITELGVGHLLSKKFVELSGGQQQRVLITLALQNNPKLLILDEPTVGVDSKTQKEFLTLLKKMNQKQKMITLLITHDIGMVPQVATRVLCISHNISAIGPASQTKKLLKNVYESHVEYHHH